MAPRRARSAYSQYIRFRQNIHTNPLSFLIDFTCNDANRERYKAFVVRVLIGVEDEGNENQKYMGNNNFSDMSKQMGNDWKEVDDLTRSIFKELAVADDKRYKKVTIIFTCVDSKYNHESSL